MTFSIVARCSKTNMFGVAVTTSSICVGSRCPHVRAKVGAVTTQNITDPRLAELVLDEMEGGLNAEKAINRIIENRGNIDYRQLAAIDRFGNTAHFTGNKILGKNAISQGLNCISAGNLLASTSVAEAITDGFHATPNEHLAERLIRGLEEGLSAGGEEGSVHSAALLVCHEMPFPLVDLRVDWKNKNPIQKLRRLWHAYLPQMQDYLNRAVNPMAAPSYGVLGDP